jgi:hypothetical protein
MGAVPVTQQTRQCLKLPQDGENRNRPVSTVSSQWTYGLFLRGLG